MRHGVVQDLGIITSTTPLSATPAQADALDDACALEVRRCRRYGRDRSANPEIPGKSQETQRQAGRPGSVRMIYKICPASAWREAERQGVYRGSADDVRDGFIHFSTARRWRRRRGKHFFGQTGLFLIAVDADALGDALRWEPSRNDELFPHLYGELDLGAVTGVLRYARAVRRHSRHPGACAVIRAFDAFSLPLLRWFDPEDAHRLAIQGLRLLPPMRPRAGRSKTGGAGLRPEFSQSDRHGRGLRQERGSAGRVVAAGFRLCRNRHR